MRGKKDPAFSTSEPLHAVWRAMLARCENPKQNRYHHYGGRGITVCPEWHDYTRFRSWASRTGYRKGLQLDRLDNDGNYAPSNCAWRSPKDQQRNRRNNRIITFQGVSKPLAEWADDPRCVVAYKVLWERLEDGWDFAAALTTPQRRKGGYRLIEAFGESKSVTEWVNDPRCQAGSVKTLWNRVNLGWPPERAITAPVRR
jgi:hypothetical protein